MTYFLLILPFWQPFVPLRGLAHINEKLDEMTREETLRTATAMGKMPGFWTSMWDHRTFFQDWKTKLHLACVLYVLCLVTQSCLTLCDSLVCSLPGYSSMEFFRQEYWSRLSFLPPGEPASPVSPAWRWIICQLMCFICVMSTNSSNILIIYVWWIWGRL